MQHRARLTDIATRSGVSAATVDRVLHGRPNVRPATADRVLDAAQALGYLSPVALEKLRRRTRPRIVVLLPATANPFLRQLNHELRLWAATRDRGARIQSFLAEGLSPTELSSAMRRIGRRADAVAFFGVDHPEIRAAADALVEAGKLVMTLISDISDSRRQACISIDNVAAGRTAAFLLASLQGVQPGHLGLLTASPGLHAHRQREEGFRSVIRDAHPHLSVAETLVGGDNPQANARVTRELVHRRPDLCGIYNAGGASEGVAQALREAGLSKRVRLVGHGFSPDTHRLLLANEMFAVLTHRPQTMFEVMLDQVLSRTTSSPAPIPMQIIFPTNLPTPAPGDP